jgi:hypothetical protein
MTKLVMLFVLTLCAVASAQPTPPPAPPAGMSAARQACADAMNADPEFAKSIVSTVDKQIDQKTIDAHVAAANQIAENERHVIFAYAAMWILAVIFIVFMWRRQQALKTELVQLRKDLDAAAKA